MRRFATLLLVLLCANGPPRCVETDTFLADPSEAEPDARLVGEWFGILPDGYVRIYPEDSDRPGVLRIVAVQIPQRIEKQPVAYVMFRAWRTSLGGKAYLNLELMAEDPKGYWNNLRHRMIVRYDYIDDASTRFWLMDRESSAQDMIKFLYFDSQKIAEAIKSGELAGRVEGEGKEQLVTIMASREALRAYLVAKGSDDALWRKTGDNEVENLVLLLRLPTRNPAK